MLEGLGWLGLAAAAGMLLNATPCVLPAIPLKLRLLLDEGGRSPLRRLATGGALLAGSLTFFLTLGVLVSMLQWSWGTPMGSPVFRAALALVLALAAAALIFDLARLPIPQRLAQWRGRGPFEGFTVGVAGGVLSLPCTGPFLGGVLAFSLTQPISMTLALFGAVGLGMALPYLVLLAFPQWAPRAGLAGQVGTAVTRLLGFGLLAGALFYGHEFLPQPLAAASVPTLVLAALLVWMLVSWRPHIARVERITAGGAVAVVAAAMALLAASPASRDDGGLRWQSLATASAAPGEVGGPALIEFTADWCINCKVLERTVYREPAVAEAAGDTVSALRVDLTDFDAQAQRLLRAWGGTGLPYAVVVNERGEVARRLRDLFGRGELVEALQQVRGDPARPSQGS